MGRLFYGLFLSEINWVKKSCWVGQVSNLKAGLCRKEKGLAYLCFWWHWVGSECCVSCGMNNCHLSLSGADEYRSTVVVLLSLAS